MCPVATSFIFEKAMLFICEKFEVRKGVFSSTTNILARQFLVALVACFTAIASRCPPLSMDCRGVSRGRCLYCGCGDYDGGSVGKKCLGCCHAPGKHKNMDVITSKTTATTVPKVSVKQLVTPVPKLAESPASLTESLDMIPELDLAQETESVVLFGNFESELSSTTSLAQCIYPDCVRPKYGKHNFCGWTHAKAYHDLKASSEELCNTPGCTNRKYCKGDGMFDYCSKYCRDNKQEKGQIVLLRDDLGTCDLPDCEEIKYQDPSNGRVHNFCSRSHAEQAKLEGISNPESNSSISLVDLAAEEGIEISKTFKQKWDSRKGKCPAICFIFSVKNTFLKQTWHTYKKTLQDSRTELHFHGTLLKCNITAQGSLCTNSDCSICSIVTTGFDRRCIRKNINFQRFGHGFYVAPNSSKCHDYTQGMHGFRAMILLEVCPGKKYVRNTDDETLKEPPSGYNSVYGISGKSLNYDELVLYNPDCAFPKYIIVYQHNGEHKIAK